MAAARVQLWPLDAGVLAADCTALDWLTYWPAGADLADGGRAADAHLADRHQHPADALVCQLADRMAAALADSAGGGR